MSKVFQEQHFEVCRMSVIRSAKEERLPMRRAVRPNPVWLDQQLRYFSALELELTDIAHRHRSGVTRDNKGNTWTTSKFGDGAITRGPDGQTITTSKFGSGYTSRDNQGGTTTTSKFGDGTITRGNGGGTETTSPFGSGYITRGSGTGGTPSNNSATGNLIVLPARK